MDIHGEREQRRGKVGVGLHNGPHTESSTSYSTSKGLVLPIILYGQTIGSFTIVPGLSRQFLPLFPSQPAFEIHTLQGQGQ